MPMAEVQRTDESETKLILNYIPDSLRLIRPPSITLKQIINVFLSQLRLVGQNLIFPIQLRLCGIFLKLTFVFETELKLKNHVRKIPFSYLVT